MASYSDSPDGGIDVVYSQSLEDKIKTGAKDSCKALNNECLQIIWDVIKGTGVVDTRSIQTRQLEHIPVAALINNLITGIKMYDPAYDPYEHHVPIDISNDLADASEIAVVTDTAQRR